jgi:hypothetical protein
MIATTALAGVPASFTYEGKVLNSAGTAPLTSVISLTLSLYDPSGTCLLYQEQQANIDLSQTNGLFAVQVGSVIGAAKRTINDPALSLANIFANGSQVRAVSSTNCTAGYIPSTNDTRLLRVAVTNGGSTVTISPDLQINSVPNAVVAETVQGQTPAQLNPPGGLLAYVGTTCPSGYLAADGTPYSATLYPNLALALKNGPNYTYGGTVSGGSFNVPNASGAFIRGVGSQTVGGVVYSSAAQGTTQADQLQGHLHTATPSFTGASYGATPLNVYGVTAGPGNAGTLSVGISDPISDGSNGTPRYGTENRPMNISVLYCVKY